MRVLLFVFLSLFLTSQSWAQSNLPECPKNWRGKYKKSELHNCFTNPFTHRISGEKYWGEWRNGKQHGQGTATYANGDKYVGEYKDDQPNGQGTNTVANGNKYVGEFKDGKYHGQGSYTFAINMEFEGRTARKGDRFVGEFAENWPKGEGIYYHADGRIEEGVWDRFNFLYAKDLTPEPQIVEDDGKLHNASSGSGFAVTGNGYVVTNNHVVNGCTDVIVHHKGNQIKTTVVAYDPINDLALLKATFTPDEFLRISNNDADLLQDVFVAGFPFGHALSTSIKVTKGIVSSLSGLANNYSNMQIDAALQQGNSGGPIIDDKGNVIGVAVSKIDLKFAIENLNAIPEGTNFGIKSSVLKNFLRSNSIALQSPSDSEISKKELGQKVTNATYFLSCWMTTAQIKEMQSKKVMFDNLGVQ